MKCDDCGKKMREAHATWLESDGRCECCKQIITIKKNVCRSCDGIRELSSEQFDITVRP